MSASDEYLFGYGSLIESGSRAGTWPGALYASPANVRGVRRGWFDRVPTQSLTTTYLGAVEDSDSSCNGVIFKVSPDALASYDQRESGYTRLRIPPSQIDLLDGSPSPPDGTVWFFASQKLLPSSPEFPIVQSYVDVCLNGCLEIEAAYPLAAQAKFAETFLRSCSDWSDYWVNDRLYPRRPFIYCPNASQIDDLIVRTLGSERFAKICIEPAPWETAGGASGRAPLER